jgi:6-phosphogluconolactonase (cycloisomerase 2 family)
MKSVKKCAVVFCVFIFVISANISNAKSLYVMQNFRVWPQIYTYDINGVNLERIDEGNFGTSLAHPICPAIHESAYGRWLFNTIEYENAIELVDIFKDQDNKIIRVENALPIDWTDNNTGGMCGIVIDNDKSKLYFVQRYTNRLWSYSWNPRTESLSCDFDYPSYVELDEIECAEDKDRPIGAYGVALDEQNDLLYVADNNSTIKYYNTNNWSLVGQINVACNAISVAIDETRHKLYYASMGHVYGAIHVYINIIH